MPKNPLSIFVSLSLLVLLVTAGCGSSNQNFVVTGAADKQGSIGLSGRVFLGGAVPGAELAAISQDGSVVAEGVTRSDGSFSLRGVLPEQFVLRATLAGEGLEFYSQGTDSDPYLVVNVPTTLAYLQQRASGGSLAEAESKVRQLLGVSATSPLQAFDIESSGLEFSHLELFREAALAGGWVSFSQALLASTESQSVIASPRFILSQSTVSASYTGLEPGLLEVAESARRRTVVFANVGPESPTMTLLKFVGEGVASSIRDPLIEDAWTWIGSQVGFNWGTTEKLNEILMDLNQVLSDLDTIESTLLTDALDTKISNLDSTVTAVKSTNNSLITETSDVQITDEPFTPTSDISNLLADLASSSASEDLASLQGALTGNNNSFEYYQNYYQTEQLGVQPGPSFANLPLRSGMVNGTLNNFQAYYLSYQTLALNIMAEAAHSNINADTGQGQTTPNLANEITQLLPVVRKTAFLEKEQTQQLMPTFAAGSVVVDLQNGLMWYAQVSAPMTFSEARAYADNMTVNPDPRQSELSYRDWRLPTYQECLTLQARGRYCKTKDLSVPANSDDAYPDTGQSGQGLTALGFSNVDNLNENGSIWFASYVKGQKGYPDNEDNIFFNQGIEFRLNHLSDNQKAYDNNTQEQPVIFVRSIGPALLDWQAPELDSPSGYEIEYDVTVPTEVATYQPLIEAEAPFLGVPTGVAFSADSTVDRLMVDVTYTIYLGGDFTMGVGDKTQSFSVPAPAPTSFTVSSNRAAIYSTPGDQDSTLPPPAGTVSNLQGEEGELTWHTDTVTPIPNQSFLASILAYVPDSGFPVTLTDTKSVGNPSPPVRQLTEIVIMPRNIFNEDRSLPNAQFQCMGYYTDETVADLTSKVTWSLQSAPDGVTLTDGLLELPDFPSTAPPSYTFTLKAEITESGGTVSDSTDYKTVTN